MNKTLSYKNLIGKSVNIYHAGKVVKTYDIQTKDGLNEFLCKLYSSKDYTYCLKGED